MIRLSRLLLVAAFGCSNQDASPPAPVVVADDKREADSPAAPPDVKPAAAKVEPPVAPKTDPPAADASPVAFPADAAGKALAKILPPAPPARLTFDRTSGPAERKLPASLSPDYPLPDAPAVGVRRPLPARQGMGPSPAPERVPEGLAPLVPALPEAVVLPTGSSPRVSAPDSVGPAPLAPMARQHPDRAPLGDPSAEFTIGSVINPTPPVRGEPAPFAKAAVPDPFENAPAVKDRTPAQEDPNKALGTVPPPKP